MKPSYSLILNEIPKTIAVPDTVRVRTLLIQAQGGDVCYRFGGDHEAVDGFILRQNEFLTTAPPLTVWATGLEARIVIQEMA